MHKNNQWVIIGASSTIAKAFVRIAASHGDDIILTGRHEMDLKNMSDDLTIRYGISCKVYRMDINNILQYQGLMDLCENSEKMTHIFMAAGVLMDESHLQMDDAKQILQTNFMSPALFLHQWIETFKSPMGGIIVLGSVAGDKGRAKNAVYGASKGGLAIYLEGLRVRVFSKNIHVLLVKPGPIDTQMTFHMSEVPFLAPPDACAAACWKAYEKKRRVIYYPSIWRYIMTLVKAMPFFIFRRIKN